MTDYFKSEVVGLFFVFRYLPLLSVAFDRADEMAWKNFWLEGLNRTVYVRYFLAEQTLKFNLWLFNCIFGNENEWKLCNMYMKHGYDRKSLWNPTGHNVTSTGHGINDKI